MAPGQKRGERRRVRVLPIVLAASAAAVSVALIVWVMAKGGGEDGTIIGTGAEHSVSPSAEDSAGESGGAGDAGDAESAESTDDPRGQGDATGAVDQGSEQAAAIDSLLDDSRSARAGLAPAIQRILSCGETASDVTTIANATQARSAQLARAQLFAVDALANGEQAKTDLIRALTASMLADQHFHLWAVAQVNRGCSGRGQDLIFTQAEAYSRQATSAKLDFLRSWNPIAREHGFPQRKESQI
jgi:hypothetical protein